jgi:hypothetical protein
MLSFLALSACSKVKNIELEYYLTARNPDRGIYDNGVFHFPLNSKSIKVPYADMRYRSISTADSAFELFYFKQEITVAEWNRFQETIEGSDTICGKPRCLFVVTKETCVDTFFMDRAYILAGEAGKGFRSNAIKEHLLSLMPKTLKENWEIDLFPIYAVPE